MTEKRLWFNWVVLEATEEEMDALGDRIAGAIGCTDDPGHVCPHFRMGGYRLPDDDWEASVTDGQVIELLERRTEVLEAALREGGCQFYIGGDIGACWEHEEDELCAACAALQEKEGR